MNENNSNTNGTPALSKPLLAEVYGDILKLYADNDELRPWTSKPFFIDNLAMATNCHELIFFDKKLIDFKLPFCENPQPHLVINNIPTERNQSFLLDTAEIEKCIKEIPLVDVIEEVDEDIKCSECKGEGEVEWEYDCYSKMGDCPKCDGDGLQSNLKYISTGEKEIDRRFLIDIKESRISIEIINRLLKVKELLNEKEILLTFQNGENKGNIFKIGEVEILCMPSRKVSNDDMVVLNLR